MNSLVHIIIRFSSPAKADYGGRRVRSEPEEINADLVFWGPGNGICSIPVLGIQSQTVKSIVWIYY